MPEYSTCATRLNLPEFVCLQAPPLCVFHGAAGELQESWSDMDEPAEGEVAPSHNPHGCLRLAPKPGCTLSPLEVFARHTTMDRLHRGGTVPARILHSWMTVAAKVTAFLDAKLRPQVLNGPTSRTSSAVSTNLLRTGAGMWPSAVIRMALCPIGCTVCWWTF